MSKKIEELKDKISQLKNNDITVNELSDLEGCNDGLD